MEINYLWLLILVVWFAIDNTLSRRNSAVLQYLSCSLSQANGRYIPKRGSYSSFLTTKNTLFLCLNKENLKGSSEHRK